MVSPYGLDSTELYDPATNTFAASASTPAMNARRLPSATAATPPPNGKVFIAGGSGSSSTELYTPGYQHFRRRSFDADDERRAFRRHGDAAAQRPGSNRRRHAYW